MRIMLFNYVGKNVIISISNRNIIVQQTIKRLFNTNKLLISTHLFRSSLSNIPRLQANYKIKPTNIKNFIYWYTVFYYTTIELSKRFILFLNIGSVK